MTSHNAKFMSLADAQGIFPGSAEWDAGGLHPLASQTGGDHADYGWHHEVTTDAQAQAIIANAAHRHVHYDGEPYREGNYYIAGRPLGWHAELPGDDEYGDEEAGVARGGHYYGPQLVTGRDLEHAGTGLLTALAGTTGLHVRRAGLAGLVLTHPAEVVAKALLRSTYAAHAGALRHPDGGLREAGSDRTASHVLHNLRCGVLLGCIDQVDAWTLRSYIVERLLPAWEAPLDGALKGGDLQWYNGVAWAGPELWAILQHWPPGETRRRLYAVLRRMCEQQAKLTALVPGRSCQVERVTHWGADMTAADVVTATYYGPWGQRMARVAALVIGVTFCLDEAEAECARWKGNTSPLIVPWIVAADGSPLN